MTAAQIPAVQASFERTHTAARQMGAELIARERALDQSFAKGMTNAENIVPFWKTIEIGNAQGRLRAAHPTAHLETRSILTLAQVASYDRLRGYANGVPGGPDGHHHDTPNR